jgi:hypothetical protein
MDINFNTQKLVIKPEYVDAGTIEVIEEKIAFAGVKYDSIRLFDPKNEPEENYYYLYTNGLDYIFDIVNI